MFDELGVLYRGILLGFVVAAPVGPIGLLCIRRTVQKGLLIGFATGIGAAIADAFFGAIAAFGVVAILGLLEDYQSAIRTLGGAILIAMAWKIWRTHHYDQPPQQEISVAGFAKAVISGLVLTFTNPVTIFAVLAVVTTLGGKLGRVDASILTAGIFCGSLSWWLILSGGVTLVRHRFTENSVKTVNRITAVLLIALAVWAIISGAGDLLSNPAPLPGTSTPSLETTAP